MTISPPALANIYKVITYDYPYFIMYRLYELVRFGFSSPLQSRSISKNANIILHGESLNSVTEFPDGDFLCCNQICTTSLYSSLKPKHYVLLDPQYYDRRMSKAGKPIRENTLIEINRSTNWDLSLYFPLEAKSEKLEEYFDNPHIDLKYFSKAPIPTSDFISKVLFFKTTMMPPLFNVSIAVISMAVKLGYKNINIYGLDLTYYKYFFVDSNNKSYVKNSHFYEDEGSSPFMVASKALGGYVEGSSTTFFQRMYQSLYAHELLAKLISQADIQIINHSIDSVVDVYKRK